MKSCEEEKSIMQKQKRMSMLQKVGQHQMINREKLFRKHALSWKQSETRRSFSGKARPF